MISQTWKSLLTRRMIAPIVALATVMGLGTRELVKPTAARAAVMSAAPAAGPLDDNSVSALLSLDHAMETLAARVTPAIVNVTVTAKTKVDLSDEGMPQLPEGMEGFGQFFGRPMQPQNRIEHGLGSGVIISPDGYIVTNNHVVNGATDIRVTLSDRRILSAKLVGADPLTDLAVIKVNGSNFASVPWGDSTKLKPGQTVLAFGNPFGFRFTVTRGIVSALNRPNPDSSDPRKPGQFIQTDAAINQGNSGGPLVDSRGELMGINTFLISATGGFSGMGFAIPAQVAQPTVEKLVRYGKVDHARMGVSISDVTPDNAKFFDLKNATGALITDVQAGSPAAAAGIKTGDVVKEIDGKPVEDASELQMTIGMKSPGDKVALQVMRDGKPENFTLKLVSLDDD